VALKFKNLSKTVREEAGITTHHPPHFCPSPRMEIRPWTHFSLPRSSEEGDSRSLLLSQYHFSRPESEAPFREGISCHGIHRVQSFSLEPLGATVWLQRGLRLSLKELHANQDKLIKTGGVEALFTL